MHDMITLLFDGASEVSLRGGGKRKLATALSPTPL